MKRFLSLALASFSAWAGLAACTEEKVEPPPRLKGPMAMHVAGPLSSEDTPSYMFVAGGEKNVVYVLDLQALGFVRAPNMFFPLEIVVGPAPTGVSSTSDNRFALILCALDSSVWFIDTETLKVVRDAAGEPVRAAVGAGATSILRAPRAEGAPGVGANGADRFYVTNTSDRSLSVLDIASAGETVTITAQPPMVGIGAIHRAVFTRDGRTLYGADLSQPFVHKIDLASGGVVELDAGGPASDVALARRDGVLYVARADTASIEVLDPDTGKRIDTDPPFAPRLPASEPFPGIFLNRVPRRLTVLEQEGPLEVHCRGGEGQSEKYSSFAVVATEPGDLYFVDAARHELVEELACVPPEVTSVADDGLFSTVSIFTTCTDQTPARRRNYCDAPSGVVLFPGFTTPSRWTLVYEAIIPGLDRKGGGGTLVEPNLVGDIGIDLNAFGIEPGDRLIVTSTPADSLDCRAQYGEAEDLALREFEILALEASETGVRLRIEDSIRTECFPIQAGALAYQVRAGGSFLLASAAGNQPSTFLGRMRPGQTFGASDLEAVRFTLRGEVLGTRDQVYEFRVDPAFSPFVGGRVFDASSQAPVPAGYIPTAMVLADSGAGSTRALRLFVAYGGSDTIIGIQPFDNLLVNPNSTLLFR